MIDTFDLGVRGMELNSDGKGKYVRTDAYNAEISEWAQCSDNNRQLAENLLKQQDKEIEAKDKEIFALKAELFKLEC